MSELSGEGGKRQSHGGSSVSIFSAEGVSSASGTSEVGHVIVDELSDNSLNNLVEETAKTVRRMTLETRMFEGTQGQFLMAF